MDIALNSAQHKTHAETESLKGRDNQIMTNEIFIGHLNF